MIVRFNPWTRLFPEAGEILEKLANSPFEFYLTGSRYFGTETPESDWDFFTGQNPYLADFLIKIGFYRASIFTAKKYAGNTCIELWYYHNPISTSCDNDDMDDFRYSPIQIQVVESPIHKLSVQEKLRDSGLIGRDKTQNKKLWMFAMSGICKR